MEGRVIMFSEKMQAALNEHINAEFYSSYLYLSMSAYFHGKGLNGFANWTRVQAQEELMHAMKMYDFLNGRGGNVALDKIEKPTQDWESTIAVFEDILSHERHITSLINNLANIAVEEKDHATQIFLQWFVTEQVEEESNVGDILNKLKLTGGEGNGLFMLDREAAARVFVMPTATN